MKPIYITGAGIVSAIGVGKAETLASLKAGTSGIGRMRYLASCHNDLPVGEVKLSNEEMVQQLGIASDLRHTRTALMGRLALREALAEAGLQGDALRGVHFISATTVGGMDRRESYYENEKDCDDFYASIATHNCGTSTEVIAETFGHFASLQTVSTACSSATNAIITGANMLRNGLAEIVVVGGTESLTKFHLNGFNALMILDSRQCRPFDHDRAGLNLGEGAAYLVLETAKSVKKRGAKPLCVLSGYGNACDAFHQTASSPDGQGAFMAMQEALQLAGLKPEDIQYINAHGTGTPNNDESESQAIMRLFGQHLPPVSSTKSFTGHTTSASGSIEAVFCLLALQHQFLLPNINWHTPMENGIIPVTDPQPQGEIRHILSNAFGFGGNDSSIILSKDSRSEDVEQSRSEGVEQRRRIFIQAAEQISIQNPLSEEWLSEPLSQDEPLVKAINPSFRDYMAANEARRMGNLMKRALVTTLKVLSDTGIEHPDAIITGTSLGSLDYSERFLDSLTANGEEALSPTYFMQSTHNTVGSALAIYTKTHGYNTTYSHGAISFDLTVLDAWMQMQLGKISTALVGGHDEMTESYFGLLKKVGYVGVEGMVPCGEVAMSMMLNTAESADNLCELAGIRVCFRPSGEELQAQLDTLLAEAGMTVADLSAVMTGANGNPDNDRLYEETVEALFPQKPVLTYKHLFGENYTVSALGLYAAARLLKEGSSSGAKEARSSMLLLNQTPDGECSMILLKRI